MKGLQEATIEPQQKTKEQEKKEEDLEENKEDEVIFNEEENKKEITSPEPNFPGDTSNINPSHQEQSISSSLFDVINNEEETDKISFTSMLEHLGQYIYVFCKSRESNPWIAGYDDQGVLTCERYDVQKDFWREIAPLTKPRTKFGAATAKSGEIFIIGGKFPVVQLKFTF